MRPTRDAAVPPAPQGAAAEDRGLSSRGSPRLEALVRGVAALDTVLRARRTVASRSAPVASSDRHVRFVSLSSTRQPPGGVRAGGCCTLVLRYRVGCPAVAEERHHRQACPAESTWFASFDRSAGGGAPLARDGASGPGSLSATPPFGRSKPGNRRPSRPLEVVPGCNPRLQHGRRPEDRVTMRRSYARLRRSPKRRRRTQGRRTEPHRASQ